jgi:hypothetical protein
MSEWWTYTVSDFLLFSPRTYYRMIERYNAATWPGQLAALGLGLVIAWLLYRPGRQQGRIVSAMLALLWAWVAWAFLWQRYATIHWAARYVALAFGIEAVLLVMIGVVRGSLAVRWSRDAAGLIGMGLFVFAAVLYPLLAPLLGRGWRQAELFGMVPDPTAVGTLGVLLAGRPLRPWILAVPVLWCVISGTMLWAMGSPEVWVLLLTALLVLAARRLS